MPTDPLANSLNELEVFLVLVTNEPLKKADAIILLEGDGYNRIPTAIQLFQQKFAPKVVVSGGISNPSYGSFPLRQKAALFTQADIPANALIFEENSQNTRDQAVEVMKICQTQNWQKILLVASAYHQYRAFLTFLKAMQDAQLQLQIINAPCRDLLWFSDNPWGKRSELLQQEFIKIKKYQQKGDVALLSEAITYQAWKETQA